MGVAGRGLHGPSVPCAALGPVSISEIGFCRGAGGRSGARLAQPCVSLLERRGARALELVELRAGARLGA